MAPRSQVPDTTVLVEAIRDLGVRQDFLRGYHSGYVWLSSVVAAELYAGTRSREDSRAIDAIVTLMARTERLLTPTEDEWALAGKLIARRVRLRGPLRPRDHLADVLILVSAARLKGTVVTANTRHFAAWVNVARAAGLDVTVTNRQA